MNKHKITFTPARLRLSPEAQALAARIQNPQDLDDALLAVRVEEMARRLARSLMSRADRRALGL